MELLEVIPGRNRLFLSTMHRSLVMKLLHLWFCFSDKHWCAVDWFLFRKMGMKCDDDQITPIYGEHPVLDLPSCSLISSYQFLGKSEKQHALLLSGNNPSLMRTFPQGLRIQVCTCGFRDGRVQVTASCKVIQDSLRIRHSTLWIQNSLSAKLEFQSLAGFQIP